MVRAENICGSTRTMPGGGRRVVYRCRRAIHMTCSTVFLDGFTTKDVLMQSGELVGELQVGTTESKWLSLELVDASWFPTTTEVQGYPAIHPHMVISSARPWSLIPCTTGPPPHLQSGPHCLHRPGQRFSIG